MDMLFSEWLQNELTQRGWSQADLARASGLTRAAISRYINQERSTPDLTSISAIADAFKIPPEFIMEVIGFIPTLPPVNPNFLAWLKSEMARRNLSIEDVAQQSGVAYPVVNRLITQGKQPGIRFITALAPVFDVSTAQIAALAGFIVINPTEEQAAAIQPMAETFLALSPEDQQELIQIAKLKLERQRARQKAPDTQPRRKPTGPLPHIP